MKENALNLNPSLIGKIVKIQTFKILPSGNLDTATMSILVGELEVYRLQGTVLNYKVKSFGMQMHDLNKTHIEFYAHTEHRIF